MKTFIIGDIHGCSEELDLLLSEVRPAVDDRLLFLGDLVDKGPDSIGVIRRVGELCKSYPGSLSLCGNHEEKALRRYEKKQLDRLEPWAQSASAADWNFLNSLPLLHRFDGFIAIHGGFFPRFFSLYPEGIGEVPANWRVGGGKKMDRMRRFLRVRNVNEEGNMVQLSEIKPEHPHWSSVYDGSQGFAFFGHDPQPVVPLMQTHAMGLDTGCVHGKYLTAAVVENGKIVQVIPIPSKKEYAKPLMDLDE